MADSSFHNNTPNPPSPWLIVMAGSVGGIHAVKTVLAALPANLPAAVVVIQHRTQRHDDRLKEVLGRATPWPVRLAESGERIEAGHVYLSRADSHLTITPEHAFVYRDGSRIRFLRSSANPLFESAARVYDGHVIAVVLTGYGRDATDGVQGVKAHGGTVIAQDPATSEQWSMPQSAIQSGAVDYVLPLSAIGPALDDLIHRRPVRAVAAAG